MLVLCNSAYKDTLSDEVITRAIMKNLRSLSYDRNKLVLCTEQQIYEMEIDTSKETCFLGCNIV
jgi:hypothetical protein